MRFSLLVVLVVVTASGAAAVDGVLEINQTCAVNTGCFAGDTSGFPVTIGAAGSYRLTGNLDSSGSLVVVDISANNAMLDLNGFQIACHTECLGGHIRGGSGVSVSNGRIVGGYGGIRLGAASSVDHVLVTDAGVEDGAIMLGPNSRLTNSQVILNNLDGVTVGSSSYVSGNVIRDNGIHYGFGRGLAAGDHAVITDNVVSNNHDCNIDCGSGCRIEGNTANGSVEDRGIRATSSIVTNNVASGNSLGSPMFPRPGIECRNCTLVGNIANDNVGVGFSDLSGTSGYSNNQFNNNNGGNANPQVSGGIEMGTNICGGDTTCP